MNSLPPNVIALISAYSKPMTRPNWRKHNQCQLWREHHWCDLWDQIIDSPVFETYYYKKVKRMWSFKGNVIFEGKGNFQGYFGSLHPNFK